MKKNKKTMSSIENYDIKVGDRFYLNSHTVKKNLSLPDYNIITWIKGQFFGVKYENHEIGNLERIMGINVLNDSNLNPYCTNPSWIFVK